MTLFASCVVMFTGYQSKMYFFVCFKMNAMMLVVPDIVINK